MHRLLLAAESDLRRVLALLDNYLAAYSGSGHLAVLQKLDSDDLVTRVEDLALHHCVHPMK